jgi:hypothetical protein
MADRIFGPIRGAGVQVREREPERNIVPGQLGSVIFMDPFERGAEDDISICPSKRALLRKMGGLLDPADFNAMSFASLEGPLAANHFYDHSEGAGYQVNLRVVPKTNDATNDDRPDKSYLPVWGRQADPVWIGQLVAHNGGRWAGQQKQFFGEISGTPGTDFPTDNQILLYDTTAVGPLTAKTLKRDEWAGALCVVHGLSASFPIVSHTSAGLLTFESDVDFPTLWAAAGPPSDYAVTLIRDNMNYRGQEKSLTAYWKDGTLDPASTFGLTIKVDGVVYLDYEILSMDTNSPFYWKDVIESDPNNDLITVTDDFGGNRTVGASRPANRYGESATLTASTLTIADPVESGISSPVGAWAGMFTFTAWGASVVPQRIRVELTDDTPTTEEVTVTMETPNSTGFAIGSQAGIGNRQYVETANLATGIAVTMDEYGISFSVGAGTGTATQGDYFYIWVRPMYVNEMVGGKINPDTDAATVKTYTITSNTRTTISVSGLDDLTDGATVSAGEEYIAEYDERAGYGYDGYIAGMTTTDYESLLDPGNSPLLKLKTMNLGLVKLALPGIAKPTEAVALQQKAAALCLSYNWMFRAEMPDEYEQDQDMLDWVNGTLGRQDLTVIFVPTFMNIRDPLADSGSDARELSVSTVGMQLGREALVARQWDGYHKAAAGVDVTLPLITSSDVLGRPDDPVRLNEELLNPAGLNAYRWTSGGTNIVAWGDRTLDATTVFRWKHKREQLSHYENVLIENFDWAIFQINDPVADADVLAALHSYFIDEWRKRAIRGSTFVGGQNPAAIIKMDEENNTDATRDQGDQNVEISLRFADVVERLKIIIGAMGVTEAS